MYNLTYQLKVRKLGIPEKNLYSSYTSSSELKEIGELPPTLNLRIVY